MLTPRPLCTALLLLLLACEVPAPTPPKTAGKAVAVGLDAVRKRGKLRLLTRNNGTTYFVLRGRQLGFDYELGERFAKRLGVELEVIVPPNWGDLIPMLLAGEGDVIAAAMNATIEREEIIDFADPYTLTHMRVVWGPGQTPLSHAEELSGKQVHVREHSAYNSFLQPLSQLLERAGRTPVDIIFEGETLETEQILIEVAAGRIPYSLCDYHICVESKAFSPELIIGPPVGYPQGLAWATHPDAGDMLAEINEFFKQQRGIDLATVYQRYYAAPLSQAERKRDKHYVDKSGRISGYDRTIQAAAAQHNLDWVLLASQAFQESRFNAKAKTSYGGRGLFGMLPRTARALGIKKLMDPKNAAKAAAMHLSAMRYKFAQLPKEEDQLKMALAAYHSGPEHITDARILASQRNLSADDWQDVAKALPLLAHAEHAARAKHGYVRGRATVIYVREIWDRYRAYRHALGDRDFRPKK